MEIFPPLLLPEQKEHCTAGANDLIQSATNEPHFLKKVITEDESWVYGYDLGMNAMSLQWKLPGSPHLRQVWQMCSKIKTMLTAFFDWESVVHHESPLGQTTNKEKYTFVFHQLRDTIQPKWLQLWATGDWKLHHDNTPCIMSLAEIFDRI